MPTCSNLMESKMKYLKCRRQLLLLLFVAIVVASSTTVVIPASAVAKKAYAQIAINTTISTSTGNNNLTATSNNTAAKTIMYNQSSVGPSQVVTPWGIIPKDHFHKLPNGSVFDFANESKIERAKENNSTSYEQVMTPPLKAKLSSYEKNNSNSNDGNVLTHLFDAMTSFWTPQPAAASIVWNEFAYVPIHTGGAPSAYHEFVTYITVPTAPVATYSGSMVLWLAQELYSNNVSPAEAMQVTLQYGSSAAGGGNYWSLVTWWYVGSTMYAGGLEQVSAGDTIVMIMNQKDSSDWTGIGSDLTSKANVLENFSSTPTFNAPYLALISNGLSLSCNDWPANVEWTNIQLQGGTFTANDWSAAWDRISACKIAAPTINSATDIHFHIQS